MDSPKLRAAAVGGMLIGVLSVAPIVAIGNLCCCLWLVSGGVLAAWFLQQRQPDPISSSDGLVVGLMAGVIGAFVYAVLAVPLAFITAPFMDQWLERAMQGAGDARVQDAIERYRGAPFRLMGVVLGFLFQLFFGAVFATLGGLLGAALFKKPAPALPPPLPPNLSGPPPFGP
ncbi:MAG: hypothetical protein AB7I50_02140 [Vicinamibacterales bacterium]